MHSGKAPRLCEPRRQRRDRERRRVARDERIRRNDAFNTVTSIFYFVFLFASSMFYPLDPLPEAFRRVAYANPITWQVDVLRYATVGIGEPRVLMMEAAAFCVFTAATFLVALWSLHREE